MAERYIFQEHFIAHMNRNMVVIGKVTDGLTSATADSFKVQNKH